MFLSGRACAGSDGVALNMHCIDREFFASCPHGRVRINGRKIGLDAVDLSDGDTISMGGAQFKFVVPSSGRDNLTASSPRLFIAEDGFEYPLAEETIVVEGEAARPSCGLLTSSMCPPPCLLLFFFFFLR
eukprot:SAG31_NODE_4393_length_3273_cov_2.562067_5_plen_130_part_00